MNAHEVAQVVLERVREWVGQTDLITLLTGYSLAATMGAFLTIVLLFYFLVSGRQVARGLFWIVPPHRRPLAARIWTRLDPVLMRYFIGVIGVVIYATVAAYIGLGVILGIQHAVLLALLTGILEIVPVVGPTAAAILAGLVSLRTANGIINIVEYAAYATALRLSIDQIVGPVVLGRAAHVHPVLIIFCFLAGGVVLGIPGVILAVPVALVVKSTLATIYGDERRLDRRPVRRCPFGPRASGGNPVILCWQTGNLLRARGVVGKVEEGGDPLNGGVGFRRTDDAVAAQPTLAGRCCWLA